jgi:DNA-binding transcriptional ArsR family regulator
MHALDILGDPVRRRILELLAEGERSAGEIGEVVQREFGISQPAVSQHLRVLRESGFATARPDGTRRLYALDPEPLSAAAAWFDPFRRFWQPHLDALGTELARGRRQRRQAQAANEPPDTASGENPGSQDSTNSTDEKPTNESQED